MSAGSRAPRRPGRAAGRAFRAEDAAGGQRRRGQHRAVRALRHDPGRAVRDRRGPERSPPSPSWSSGTGSGRGCDICKPVAASILASLGRGHILDGEQAALQDTNDHFLANIQRNGTYSVVPRIPGGEVTPDKLIVLGEVARDFGLYTKITGGQRIDLLGARVEQLPAIWRRLVDAGFESGHAYGKAVRTVKSCVGSTWCRYGVQDSVSLAIELELRYRGIRSPHKIKAGVSGCARECAEAQSKDIGVIAADNGWNLYVGGNGGFRPRHADLLLTGVDTRNADPHHRPVHHVLHPHRRPAAAHRELAGVAGRRAGLPAFGHRRGQPRHRRPSWMPRWPGTSTGYRGRVGGGAGRPAAAAPFRVLRQRAGHFPTRASPSSRSVASRARPTCRVPRRRPARGDPVTGRHLDRRLPVRRPAARARRGGADRRRAGGAVPHVRRDAVRDRQPGPVHRGVRALPRDRGHRGEASPPSRPRCTSRSSIFAAGSAWTTRRRPRAFSASGCATASSRWRPDERRNRALSRLSDEVEPLAGYTVGITAARRREEFAAALERRGAKVVSGPAIRIVPLADDSQLRAATQRCLDAPLDVVIATTGHRVPRLDGSRRRLGPGGEADRGRRPVHRAGPRARRHAARSAPPACAKPGHRSRSPPVRSLRT